MGVVAVCDNFRGVDMHVVLACQIELQSHLRWKVEIGVKRARAVAGFHRLGRGEFIDVVGTCSTPVQTFLNTVAFGPDSREGQINLSNDSSDIEPAGVAYAAAILGLKPRADKRLDMTRHVLSTRFCVGAESKEVDKEKTRGVHFCLVEMTNWLDIARERD